MGSACLWESPPLGVVQGLLLERVSAGVRPLSLSGSSAAALPPILNILQSQDWLFPGGVYVGGERRGEGCSWEQDTCMNLLGHCVSMGNTLTCKITTPI